MFVPGEHEGVIRSHGDVELEAVVARVSERVHGVHGLTDEAVSRQSDADPQRHRLGLHLRQVVRADRVRDFEAVRVRVARPVSSARYL